MKNSAKNPSLAKKPSKKNATASLPRIDSYDLTILSTLQKEGDTPIDQIAKKTGLSRTACWNRIQNMEHNGVIQKTVRILDPKKIGLNNIVFVTIITELHNETWLKNFAEKIINLPEIIECYRLSGMTDYLLKVIIPDIDSYDLFYKKLIADPGITNVTSSFSMEQIKNSTVLPLDFVAKKNSMA